MKGKFIMIVGLPKSGKTHKAKELAKLYNAEIISGGKIKGDLADENKTIEKIKDCIKNKKSIIYDNTNIKSKERIKLINAISEFDIEKICLIVATPYMNCFAKINDKSEKSYLRKCILSWNTPYWFEGWDKIQIQFKDGLERKNIDEFIDEYKNYNQENSHHSLTLGEHCFQVGERCKKGKLLYIAGKLHDCGKPFVKSFYNFKGIKTKDAHYFSHENVGAYESLFYDYDQNPLDVSIIINLHMIPYNWEYNNSEKLKNRYKQLWGDDLFFKVMTIHEADNYSK